MIVLTIVSFRKRHVSIKMSFLNSSGVKLMLKNLILICINNLQIFFKLSTDSNDAGGIRQSISNELWSRETSLIAQAIAYNSFFFAYN